MEFFFSWKTFSANFQDADHPDTHGEHHATCNQSAQPVPPPVSRCPTTHMRDLQLPSRGASSFPALFFAVDAASPRVRRAAVMPRPSAAHTALKQMVGVENKRVSFFSLFIICVIQWSIIVTSFQATA